MYSFRMSFWIVPPSCAGSTPRFFASATSRPSSRLAVELIVIEIVTRSSGMPSSSTSMSASELIGTPTRPTSPSASGLSLS